MTYRQPDRAKAFRSVGLFAYILMVLNQPPVAPGPLFPHCEFLPAHCTSLGLDPHSIFIFRCLQASYADHRQINEIRQISGLIEYRRPHDEYLGVLQGLSH